MNLSKLIRILIEVVTRFIKIIKKSICQVVLCISRPLPNQTKLTFDQDAKLVEVSASKGELNAC